MDALVSEDKFSVSVTIIIILPFDSSEDARICSSLHVSICSKNKASAAHIVTNSTRCDLKHSVKRVFNIIEHFLH